MLSSDNDYKSLSIKDLNVFIIATFIYFPMGCIDKTLVKFKFDIIKLTWQPRIASITDLAMEDAILKKFVFYICSNMSLVYSERLVHARAP